MSRTGDPDDAAWDEATREWNAFVAEWDAGEAEAIRRTREFERRHPTPPPPNAKWWRLRGDR